VADVDAVDAYTYTQNCYMALDINIKALEMYVTYFYTSLTSIYCSASFQTSMTCI